jgi:hypothetical protein
MWKYKNALECKPNLLSLLRSNTCFNYTWRMEKQKKNSYLATMSDIGVWVWQLYGNDENILHAVLFLLKTKDNFVFELFQLKKKQWNPSTHVYCSPLEAWLYLYCLLFLKKDKSRPQSKG